MIDKVNGKCKYRAIKPINPPYFRFLVDCIHSDWTQDTIPKVCFYCKRPVKVSGMGKYTCTWTSKVKRDKYLDIYYPEFKSECGNQVWLPSKSDKDWNDNFIKQGEESIKRLGKCNKCGGKITFNGDKP